MPSGTAPTDRHENEVITFRGRTPQFALPVLLGFLGGTALLYAGLALAGDPMLPGDLWQCLSGAVTATVVVSFLCRNDGVALTEDALVVLGTRRRRILWTDIVLLEVRGIAGVRQITVHTTNGRRTTPHSPMSLIDKQFDQKVQVVTRWWQERSRRGREQR